MEIDYSILNSRINHQRQTIEFYQCGFEMLHLKYKIHDSNTPEELEEYLGDCATANPIISKVIRGEMPTEEELLQCDDNELDSLLMELMHFVGTELGLADLEKNMDEDDFSVALTNIVELTQHKETFLQGYGFSGLSLALGCAPSVPMLGRLFPETKSQDELQESMDLVREVYRDVVDRYINEERAFYIDEVCLIEA